VPEPARHAQTALDLLASVVARRSAPGWEAVDAAAEGRSQIEVAARLGISKQAVSQRLRAAEWHLEPDARDLAAHLLAVADGRVGRP
jgi:DNA-directed RNA polymerase specialized sigma24 family protein